MKRLSEGDIYRRDFLGSDSWRSLKEAMDLWCACWFWPVDEIEHAPLPTSFASPPGATRAIADKVAEQGRFFHWELEFPDVFRERSTRKNTSIETESSPDKEDKEKDTMVPQKGRVMGFDAILGNPPWDIAKPVSKEFFSNIDPQYRSYGKQEALRRQSGYFEKHAAIEREWLDYNARFRAQSNYTSHAANPFGDPVTSEKSQNRFTIMRGKENHRLHDRWRSARNRACGYADAKHPFSRQGSADLNLYKLFLETAHTLLRDGGRIGFVVPSGLYSDDGTGALRNLFLEQCCWEWLFGIENRNKVFPIDSRYKFNLVLVEKGGITKAIRTAFMRRNLEDWERAEEIATSYTLEQVDKFSPRNRALLEIQSQRDLEILEKIYANSVLLGDDGPDGWGIRYATEFHMTGDSKLFPPRPQWESKSYRPDEYSRWLKGDWRPIGELWAEMGIDTSKPAPVEVELEDWLFDTTANPQRREAEARFIHEHVLKPGDVARTEWQLRCAQPLYHKLPIARADIPEGVILSREGDTWIKEERIEEVALPLYEGRMIGQFDFSQKGWVRGKGRGAVWREIPWGRKQVEPQFLMRSSDYEKGVQSPQSPKISHMQVGSSTNTRTIFASFIYDMPAGHKAPVFYLSNVSKALVLSVIMNSLVFDYIMRTRLVGTSIDYHVLEQNALPVVSPSNVFRAFTEIGVKLSLTSKHFAPQILKVKPYDRNSLHITRSSGSTVAERTRLAAMLDALVVAMYGLTRNDLLRIVENCDLPTAFIQNSQISANLDPKGFWRVGKEKDPELRHPVLILIAFYDLEQKIQQAGGDQTRGINAFLTQNNGEGWLLPETLCLADYGLGHDDRAKQPQPVASRLGPRFYDWQLTQTNDESWRECRLHARNLLGELDYRQLLENINTPYHQDQKTENAPLPKVAEEPANYDTETREIRRDNQSVQFDIFK